MNSLDLTPWIATQAVCTFNGFLQDSVLDLIANFNLIMAGQFYFAAASTFIMLTCTVAEVMLARHENLKQELQKSAIKGFKTEPVLRMLKLEQCFDTPFSFVLSCYAWTFAIRNTCSLLNGMGTLLSGVYGLAGTIYWVEDLDLYRTKPKWTQP